MRRSSCAGPGSSGGPGGRCGCRSISPSFASVRSASARPRSPSRSGRRHLIDRHVRHLQRLLPGVGPRRAGGLYVSGWGVCSGAESGSSARSASTERDDAAGFLRVGDGAERMRGFAGGLREKISTTCSRCGPTRTQGESREMALVGITSSGARVSSPRRITEPLPNCSLDVGERGVEGLLAVSTSHVCRPPVREVLPCLLHRRRP